MPSSTWLRRLLLLLLLPLALSPAAGRAQSVPAPPPATINVFLDCTQGCDQDFVRTEIGWVNWVRDRAVADVHILVTSQGNAGGGSAFTLAFLGLRGFAGIGDTLQWTSPQGASADDLRRGLAQRIRLGLVPHLARTAAADRLTVGLTSAAQLPGGASPVAPRHDRWNSWVFSVSANGNTFGEQQSTFLSLNGSVRARRITEAWKVDLNLRNSYNQNDFRFDGQTRTSIRRSYTFSPLVVRSLTPHLSAGLRASAGSSTFENRKFFARVTPAIEYDLFPYSEFTRRSLTVQYAAGVEENQYQEETIYLKMRETVPLHTLSINLAQTQPWGSASVGIDGSQLLSDTDKYSASIFTFNSVRLFKGLSLNGGGSYSRIHNQLTIPRRGATEQEVLLQQRRLSTNYRYDGFVGLSYTFGSIFNSVVNPRFGGSGGGGGMVIMY
jgi:hypothetical protein